MTVAVLANTGPLYALSDPADQFHERAHRELEVIYLEVSSGLGKYSDHSITHVDTILAHLACKLDTHVWTFDRPVVTMRTTVWRHVAP